MYCRVLACDFDGTGATNGHPAPEFYASVAAARAKGITTVLVTGRVLEDVRRACGELSAFDAVVAENGAVVELCGLGRTVQLAQPPPEAFLGELRARGVPFHTGAVIVGTWEQHASTLLELIRRFGIDGQLVFNRAALMVLPSGINKAVGIRYALDELGRSERNLVAFGDAENDIPMLAAAEVGIAARGSVAAVLSICDDRVAQPGGAGVALYINKLLEHGGIVATPARRKIVIGDTGGKGVTLPASGTNLVVSGDPRSGKSWIAGLIAEQLIEQGYRVCIIDPEGDYAQMGQRPKVVTLGLDLPLPAPQTVARLLDNEPLSLVLMLSALAPQEQASYVDQLLGLLEEGRKITGFPHWIIVDEAHYFFHGPGPCLKYLGNGTGNFCLVTYRPSLLASEAYNSIGAHIITSTKVEEERYFVTKILQAHARQNLTAHAALDDLEPPSAGLLMIDAAAPVWQPFTPAQRITRHAHHARKYTDTRLPEDRGFRFLNTDQPLVAHNVTEFYTAIENAPAASLRHHLAAGDFSRWAGDVLGDQELARGLRKLERTTPAGATPDRSEILAHINHHYLIHGD